ncbi:MAG: bacillithiol biosynthesis cysteine-adding enzyme BshC [Balneolaceae bacterium]|nr:MAG: bacillithiol biosynthesis cysteine-adding enzyme BshC [Balneolaceae bacterium]
MLIISDVPHQNLNFSRLFTDYLADKNIIHSFFEYQPLDDQELLRRSEEISFHSDRVRISEELKRFNSGFGAGKHTLSAVEKLRNPNTLTVVTGQQLTLFGGPLFTVYKIVTSILWARKLENLTSRPVVPVFWMADEDHDFEEASFIGLFEGQELVKKRLLDAGHSGKRVSDTVLGTAFDDFRDEAGKLLFETDFKKEVSALLDSSYSSGCTFGEGFGKLILSLFGKHGLILAGSNRKEIKKLLAEPLKRSVECHEQIYSDLTDTSAKLMAAGYHSQVQVQPTNLFYIHKDDRRERIQLENDRWTVKEAGIAWSKSELLMEIDLEPEKFSPNVFLRPVLQNFVVPAAVYVAGPGEIAYYAQMRKIYSHFDLKMPLILPRFSVTLRESAIQKYMEELPFRLEQYSQRIEDLEAAFISRSDTLDLEELFSEWKNSTSSVSASYTERVSSVDSTLEATADKALALYHSELDKLKGKMYRSLKETEKVNIQRIHRIQAQLYPGRNLQEREVAFIWFMNKYGIQLWDQLLTLLSDKQPDTHKLIDL